MEPTDAPPAESGPSPLRTAADVARSATERSSRELWLETIAILSVLVIPSAVDSFLVLFEGRAYAYLGTSISELLARIAYDLGAFVLLIYVIWRSGEPWGKFGIFRPSWFVDGFTAAGILVVHWAGVQGQSPSVPGHLAIGEYLVLAMSTAAGALVQELLFRGYLITRFERLLGSAWWSLLLAAALFGAVHAYQGEFRAATAFLIGIVYGTFFLWIRTLWPLVLAHGVFNFLVLADIFLWRR